VETKAKCTSPENIAEIKQTTVGSPTGVCRRSGTIVLFLPIKKRTWWKSGGKGGSKVSGKKKQRLLKRKRFPPSTKRGKLRAGESNTNRIKRGWGKTVEHSWQPGRRMAGRVPEVDGGGGFVGSRNEKKPDRDRAVNLTGFWPRNV